MGVAELSCYWRRGLVGSGASCYRYRFLTLTELSLCWRIDVPHFVDGTTSLTLLTEPHSDGTTSLTLTECPLPKSDGTVPQSNGTPTPPPHRLRWNGPSLWRNDSRKCRRHLLQRKKYDMKDSSAIKAWLSNGINHVVWSFPIRPIKARLSSGCGGINHLSVFIWHTRRSVVGGTKRSREWPKLTNYNWMWRSFRVTGLHDKFMLI